MEKKRKKMHMSFNKNSDKVKKKSFKKREEKKEKCRVLGSTNCIRSFASQDPPVSLRALKLEKHCSMMVTVKLRLTSGSRQDKLGSVCLLPVGSGGTAWVLGGVVFVLIFHLIIMGSQARAVERS